MRPSIVALPHIVEDGVDVFQLAGLDGGLGPCRRLQNRAIPAIKPRPQRWSRAPLRHWSTMLKMESGKSPGGRPFSETVPPRATMPSARLFKSLRRNRRHQHALRTAIGFLANIGCRVGNRLSVDRNGCAKSAGGDRACGRQYRRRQHSAPWPWHIAQPCGRARAYA